MPRRLWQALNSTRQHAQFNQRLWLELEDHLLEHADTVNLEACVLTGPVFDDDDKAFRGVQLPRPTGRWW